MALKYLDINKFERPIFEAHERGIRVCFENLKGTVEHFDLNDLELAVFYAIYLETRDKEKRAFIRNTDELSATFAYTLSPELVDSIIRELVKKGCVKAILPDKNQKFGIYVCMSIC